MITTANATTVKRDRWLQLLPFFAFFILLFAFTSHLPFFWDKDLLFSKLGYWLPDHHFSLVLPNNLDAGYPPALGYLLALTWKITGRSLFSAHLLMFSTDLIMLFFMLLALNSILHGRRGILALAVKGILKIIK